MPSYQLDDEAKGNAAKYAVIRHKDGRDSIIEVLPNETEAHEWAQIFRDRGEQDVTYTVAPYDTVVTG